jgi:mitogen-activated protein kinase kinase 7
MRRTSKQEENKRLVMDLEVIRKSKPCFYIVQYYGYICTEEHLKIYMEIMLCSTEQLLYERGNVGLPEMIIGKIALNVIQGLIFLKDTLSLMHRDIKPSNILLDWNGNIKLCDFGISGKLIGSNAVSFTQGCVDYLAPERIGSGSYTANADVWSLGKLQTKIIRII